MLQTNHERQTYILSIVFLFYLLAISYCVASQQYLTCLKTSRSLTDKLSFDVGLQEDSIGKIDIRHSLALMV